MEYRTRITIPETTKNFLNHILNHPPLNLPWTQGILYDNYGREIQVSEPSDDYFGEWIFSIKKDSYIIFVG